MTPCTICTTPTPGDPWPDPAYCAACEPYRRLIEHHAHQAATEQHADLCGQPDGAMADDTIIRRWRDLCAAGLREAGMRDQTTVGNAIANFYGCAAGIYADLAIAEDEEEHTCP